uniref:Uncharacterized protein n=1 Tax=Pithovirus LCPAC102 TaxID=2506587 RepID=A0A4D5XG54_9VIRU|nr:MAG: hypothetical protein LCPAC102_01790 [Pithovirus LCPAC102]
MSGWIIFLIILIIIIIIILLLYFFVFQSNTFIKYGQTISIKNNDFISGFLSICNLTDTNCTNRLYIPTVQSTNNIQSWIISSDTSPNGSIVKCGDTVNIIPFTKTTSKIGLCGRISTISPCTNIIGLVSTSISNNTTKWKLTSSSNINIGTNLNNGQEVLFINVAENKPMSVCGGGTSACGGIGISALVTLRSDIGIADKWIVSDIKT